MTDFKIFDRLKKVRKENYMKVTISKKEKEFVPIELNMAFETLAEAAAFYAVFNHTHIIAALDLNKQAELIRRELEQNSTGLSQESNKYHDKLKKIVTKP